MSTATPPTTLVRESSLFSVLPGEAIASVVSALHPQRVDDRAFLFHAGQHADRLYLVAEGELEVVSVAGDAITHLNRVGVGQIVGELAVLRGAQRSASVRSRGRSLVYWMHAVDFMQLVHRWPALAVEIASRIASNFIHSEQRWRGKERTRVWCVHASLSPEFVVALAEAAILYLDPRSPRRLVIVAATAMQARRFAGFSIEGRALAAELLARRADLGAERERAAVVIVHGAADAIEWALADADALIAADEASAIACPVSTRRIEVARRGLASRDRIKAPPTAALDSVAPRLARTLLGRSVGLALGGGGALGYAHLGILEILEELGVGLDSITGTSMGAVIGSAYLCIGAAGLRRKLAQMSRTVDWVPLVDPGVVTSGQLSGKRSLRFLFDLLQTERFDELCTPFAAVALDLDAAEERVLSSGSLPDAVRASIGIPGVYAPHSYDSPFGPRARYVDGGMINNVPVDVARAMGVDRVIGVHVMGRNLRASEAAPAWARRLPGLSGLARLHTAAQTYLVAMARSGERQVVMADVGILPKTSAFSMYEFWRGEALADRGREAALAVRDQLAVLAPRSPDDALPPA